MTRILVQRGSGASTSNPNRPSSTSQQQPPASQASPVSKEEEQDRKAIQDPGGLDDLVDQSVGAEDKTIIKTEEIAIMSGSSQISKGGSFDDDDNAASDKNAATINDLDPLQIAERAEHDDSMGAGTGSSQIVTGGSYPPPPPVPPPKPSPISSSRRLVLGSPNAVRIGASRRPSSRPVVSTRSSPSDSRPSSPRSYVEAEGYNSADEQNSCFASSYDDTERERLFELDLRRAKGFEVKRMVEDGNCLFRAVADQVYGDPEVYDMARQMCIDYMERERDHFSQFITEGFTSYCKRKRRDKVYGNNVEIQAFSEMYNRPIHIYSYSTEPINIFHGSYNTDSPPIRLSYHYGNHYNSLVDPRRLTIGAGLGFSSLRGSNVDKDQIKAAIRAQQDQQIDNALLAEGRFCSDVELTEKEIERMVMEASRAEYLAEDKLKQLGYKESSRSGAEPSSSGATTTGPSRSDQMMEVGGIVFNSSVQMVLAMGFNYLQVIEAYSIFGEDVDSMVCYLLEMGGTRASSGSNCRKGKAAE